MQAVFFELREELGLGPDAVRDTRKLGMVEHADSHVLDLGIALPAIPSSFSAPLFRGAASCVWGRLSRGTVALVVSVVESLRRRWS
jgi:hypothetical protein